MATINSTSGVSSVFNTSYGIQNKGIGGLMSGLDTDELVEALTYSTRAKIAKQQQQKQLLQWQQTAYRSTANALSSFQTKWVKTGVNGTSLAMNATFNTYKGTSSSSNASLVPSSTKRAGTVNFDVLNLASKEQITLSKFLSKDLSGNSFDPSTANFSGQTLKVQVDKGTVKTIKLDSLNDASIVTVDDFQAELQKLIDTQVGTRQKDDGSGRESIVKVTVTQDSSGEYTVNLDSDRNMVQVTAASKELGFDSAGANRIAPNNTLLSTVFDLSSYGDELTFSINGVEMTLELTDKTKLSDLITKIQSAANGIDIDYSTATGDLWFVAENPGGGINFEFEGDIFDQWIFNDAYNKTSFTFDTANSTTPLSTLYTELASQSGVISVTIGGTTHSVSWDADLDSIDDIMSRLNSLDPSHPSVMTATLNSDGTTTYAIDSGSDYLSIEGGDLFAKVFGAANANYYAYKYDAGQNAQIRTSDGMVHTSETNTFDLDGIVFEITGVSDNITITSTVSPDDLMATLQDWVEEYNALLETLYTLIREEKVDGYEPLTDEQKAEMTDDQIKKWEEEAKKGLLKNDRTINTIIYDMRETLVMRVGSVGLSLYDIGIEPVSYLNITTESGGIDYKLAGKLKVDEDKLRTAIETNPEGVRLLFTDTEDGIAKRMNTALDKAVSTSSETSARGTLVRLAGTETPSSNNTSTIGDKIDTIDKYITVLKERLEKEYNRYWRQFTALETALSRINAQASWLDSFGT